MTLLMAIVASLAASAQDASIPEILTVRLASAPRKGAGELRFEGKAALPDGIALRGTLFRSDERLMDGRFQAQATEIATEVAGVEGKRVSWKFAIQDAGLYRLVVELREDLQESDAFASLKKPVPEKWTFDHAVWGDEFPGTLGPKLRDFDQRVDLALDLVRGFAAATSSLAVWKDHYPALDKELALYLKKLDQASLEKVYPASIAELRSTMRNLKGNAEAVLFSDDGTCKGSIDYRTKKPTKTIHSEDFTFDAILRDAEATRRAAGCEFLLWLIKDVRRGGSKAGLTETLRQEAKRPGVSPFVELLDGFKDVDVAERTIREAMARK